MNQPTDPDQNPPTAGLGERRRRREAERARTRAQGAADERPLTRRERRARDEALASGALTYGPDGLVPTAEFERIEAESLSAASAAEPPSASSAVDPVPGTRRARRAAERAATAASATSAISAATAADPPGSTPAPPEGPTISPESTPTPPSDDASAPSASDAPPPAGSSAVSPPASDTAPMVPVTRRSLRDKQAAVPAPPTMGPPETGAQRTSTGRRPVVRPPASVRAKRGVSASGELTEIQRAVREANTAAEGIAVGEQGEASSPTSWHSAVDIPAVSHEVRVPQEQPADEPAPTPAPASPADPPSAAGPGIAPSDVAPSVPTPVRAPEPEASVTSAPTPVRAPSSASAPSAASAPSTPSPEPAAGPASTPSPAPPVTADSPEEDEGTFDMTPRWESLQRTVEQTAGDRPDVPERPSPPLRVSALRSAGTQEPPPAASADDGAADDPEAHLLEEEARKTPAWLFALQMLVLVLVMAVLGVLVYLYATGDLFGDEDATGTVLGHLSVWIRSR